MRTVRALGKLLMLEDDGCINAPMSFFVNLDSNPNTQESKARSLKLLHKFLSHFKVPLADRALEGRCLEDREINGLVHLAYRPLSDLSTARKIGRFVDVLNAEMDEDRRGAVQDTSASKRLCTIAAFLLEYEGQVGDFIRSADTRDRLRAAYQVSCNRLLNASGKTGNSSAYDIRSLASENFLDCIRAAFLDPYVKTKVLLGPGGSELHHLRDRAMFMLACEGLRPGEYCNLRLNDLIRGPSGGLSVQIAVNRKHRPWIKSATPMPKGASSRRVNYSEPRLVVLWPTTRDAVKDYIDGPRAQAVAQAGEEISAGFLFLKSNGDQLLSRQAASLRFSQMCNALKDAGYMKELGAPGIAERRHRRPSSSYTMRHSAVSFMYDTKAAEGLDEEKIFDLLRVRFGWSSRSQMPAYYGRRALVDRATVQLDEFFGELRTEVLRLSGKAVLATGSHR